MEFSRQRTRSRKPKNEPSFVQKAKKQAVSSERVQDEVLPGIVQKVGLSSPFLVGGLAYTIARARLQDPDRYKTWNGRDVSEDLLVALWDAVLCAEQLQREIFDECARRVGDVPVIWHEALSHLLHVSGQLISAANRSFSVHQNLWNDQFDEDSLIDRIAKLGEDPVKSAQIEAPKPRLGRPPGRRKKEEKVAEEE